MRSPQYFFKSILSSFSIKDSRISKRAQLDPLGMSMSNTYENFSPDAPLLIKRQIAPLYLYLSFLDPRSLIGVAARTP